MQGYKFIANLGDVNFLEHGGFLIYQSEANPLDVRCVVIEPGEDESSPIREYGFSADLCFRCKDGENVSDNPYHRDSPAWFSDSLDGVAKFADRTKEDLLEALCSHDPAIRSAAYESLVTYHGITNWDSYPIVWECDYETWDDEEGEYPIPNRELQARYQNELNARH